VNKRFLSNPIENVYIWCTIVAMYINVIEIDIYIVSIVLVFRESSRDRDKPVMWCLMWMFYCYLRIIWHTHYMLLLACGHIVCCMILILFTLIHSSLYLMAFFDLYIDICIISVSKAVSSFLFNTMFAV
jgi:hypothetical protein